MRLWIGLLIILGIVIFIAILIAIVSASKIKTINGNKTFYTNSQSGFETQSRKPLQVIVNIPNRNNQGYTQQVNNTRTMGTTQHNSVPTIQRTNVRTSVTQSNATYIGRRTNTQKNITSQANTLNKTANESLSEEDYFRFKNDFLRNFNNTTSSDTEFGASTETCDNGKRIIRDNVCFCPEPILGSQYLLDSDGNPVPIITGIPLDIAYVQGYLIVPSIVQNLIFKAYNADSSTGKLVNCQGRGFVINTNISSYSDFYGIVGLSNGILYAMFNGGLYYGVFSDEQSNFNIQWTLIDSLENLLGIDTIYFISTDLSRNYLWIQNGTSGKLYSVSQGNPIPTFVSSRTLDANGRVTYSTIITNSKGTIVPDDYTIYYPETQQTYVYRDQIVPQPIRDGYCVDAYANQLRRSDSQVGANTLKTLCYASPNTRVIRPILTQIYQVINYIN